MARETCDGCGAAVPIGGGIGGFWSAEPRPTGGLSLTLEDGSEHFLCFECVDRLPETPTAADVAALPDEDPAERGGSR